MASCPFCKANLGETGSLPEKCPACGRALADAALPADERSSVQMLSESSEFPGSESVQTIDSGEVGLSGVKPPVDGMIVEEIGKTFVSDEFDDPSAMKTVQSEEFSSGELPAAEGADIDKTFVSDEFDDPTNVKTVQSEEFSLSGSESGKDGGVQQTFISDQWDESPASPTHDSGSGAGSGEAGRDSGNDQTIVSEEFGDANTQQTFLSDELPPEAVKTMQTNWSGAFAPNTSPGTSIKGRSAGKGKMETKTSLVIKQRSLSDPGEKKIGGADAEYELIKVLGEGGMGVVYDARQTSIDRSVAVKMLKPNTASDEKQRHKFLAEAVVTGDLDHPNIVPIYDVGSSERGLLFYSMKKVKGTPWMKLIQTKSQSENLEILMKSADAVAFAHSRGVIHRDLKPENIMLGEYGEVLVMDWGLALPAPGYSKNATVSPSHSMGGTPAYMAPEMASGPLEKITFASDIYLFGAMLYEILTGKAPHTGKNTMQCLFAAAKNEIRPTEKAGELMDIALKAMATDPKDRYQSVREFQDAIRDYQSHTESIALSTRAAEDLEKAEKTDDYQDYARALFGFDEAIELWSDNARAKTGASDARLKYATSAHRKGDYDLGLSLLDVKTAEHVAIYAQISEAKHEREARQHRLQTMKRVAGSLVALFLVTMTVAFFWVKSARDRAVVAEGIAIVEKDKAVESQKKEEIAKKDAIKQKEEAERAQKQEEIAKKEAVKQKEEAERAQKQEEIAKKDAVKQKEKAEEEEQKAKIAQAKAEEERQKAEIAKQKEEYEAYIARIGLAAAKIDENAFGSARELLDGCKPELRNWEWGRLMYLCGQSVRKVDAAAPIDAVAFSKDGKKFITGSWDGKARIWNTENGELLATIPHQGLYVHAVAFSPDGKYVATGSNDRGGFVRICNAETGKEVKKLDGHTDAVLSVSFSRDGRKLLTSSYDKTARLWDIESGREIQTFLGHNWWVWSAAFSPKEDRVVTASQDGSVMIWSVERGERAGQFLGHRGPVYSAAFSPDGSRIVSGGYDKRVLIWRPDELQAYDFRRLASGEKVIGAKFLTLDGHGAGVRSVSFSADGALALSGSHDNTVKVWDVETGRMLKTFRGHDSWVRSCAFSPDSRMVVSASHDHRAQLWSITDYEEVRVLQGRILSGHNDAVLAASFSRDGGVIATASRDRTAKTWDFRTGRELRSFEEGHAFLASNAVFFPGGKQLLTAAVDNTVRFWDVTSGTQTGRLDHTGRSAALTLSHNARWILTGSDDRMAKVWDAETAKLAKTLAGHKYEVTAVAFSPDDKLLFTGDANGRGIIWDAEKFTERHRLSEHTGKITAAAFLPGGKKLLTASNDKTVASWNVETGKEEAHLSLKHPDGVMSLAVVPGGKQALTSCADGIVRLWNLDKPEVAMTLPTRGLVNAVAVSSAGRQVLTSNSEERTVRLWDLETGREILSPAGNDRLGAFLDFNVRGGLLWTAVFAPTDDAILTVGGSDARLWNMQDGKERMSFSPHGIVASAGFSPDGKRLVTASWDNSAKVWNTETGTAEMKLEGEHKGYVNTAAFSPDGNFILTASDDKTALLWDAKTGKVVKRFPGHTDRVRSAVFSPDGKFILTASSDKTARLWNVETEKEIGKFEGHKWAVLSAVFSADGSRIITGSEDNAAKVWNVETRELLLSLEGHTAPVSSVAFLADGQRVVTGSLDNSAKLWDAATGKEILTLKGHSQEVTCVNTDRDGRYVLTGSRDGTAVVWLTIDWKAAEQPAAARPAERKVAAEK